MSLELILYVIFFLMFTYVISGTNIEKLFKQGRVLHIWFCVILLSMSISYLATNFVVSFLEVSKIL